MFGLSAIRSINEHGALVREDNDRKSRGLKPLSPAARAMRNAQSEPVGRSTAGRKHVTLQGRVVEV